MQLTSDGQLQHLLTTQGLPFELIHTIMDRAEQFVTLPAKKQKKAPFLRGKTVMNLFFENSTRTRVTFEIAAQRLGADVTNLDIRTSSATKGESLLDTIRNLEAMNADIFVVRHHQAGAAQFIARYAAPHISVLNAGDGRHAHPTQALLDMFTLRQKKGEFEALKVVIVGDILHSRVARSQIHALTTLRTGEVCVVAPKTLLPAGLDKLGVRVTHDMKEGLQGADAVIMLRLQRERMAGGLLPSEREFFKLYGLNHQYLELTQPDAIIMHPGPINRGVEIDSDIADGPRSVILEQVTNGIAIRMAVMSMIGNSAHRPAA